MRVSLQVLDIEQMNACNKPKMALEAGDNNTQHESAIGITKAIFVGDVDELIIWKYHIFVLANEFS